MFIVQIVSHHSVLFYIYFIHIFFANSISQGPIHNCVKFHQSLLINFDKKIKDKFFEKLVRWEKSWKNLEKMVWKEYTDISSRVKTTMVPAIVLHRIFFYFISLKLIVLSSSKFIVKINWCFF